MSALTASSVMLWYGKLDGTNFAYIVGLVLAGHNAEDCLKAFKRG